MNSPISSRWLRRWGVVLGALLCAVAPARGARPASDAEAGADYQRPDSDPFEIPYNATHVQWMEEMMDEADEAMRAGRWADAAGVLEKVVLYNSGAVPAFLALGACYQRLGYHEQALLIGNALVGRRDVAREAARLRLASLNALRRYREAAAAGKKYLDSMPEDPLIRMDEQIARGNAGQGADVISELATAYQQRSWTSKSEKDLMRAGILLAGVGRVPESETSFNRILARNPRSAPAYNGLAILRAGQGDYESAIRFAEKATEVDPTSADAWNNLAVLYARTGKDEQVVKHLRKALEVQPSHVQALRYLSALEVQRGEVTNAIEICRKAIEADPDSAALHYRMAQVLARHRDWTAAVQHLEKARKYDPRLEGPQFLLGVWAGSTGDEKSAARCYEGELALNTNHVRALNNLAWIKAASADPALRDPAGAVRLARQAFALTRETGLTEMDTLLEALSAASNYVDAATAADRAAEMAARRGDDAGAERYRRGAERYRALSDGGTGAP
jgi:tetratricopeptide (TPR) repeat protein